MLKKCQGDDIPFLKVDNFRPSGEVRSAVMKFKKICLVDANGTHENVVCLVLPECSVYNVLMFVLLLFLFLLLSL